MAWTTQILTPKKNEIPSSRSVSLQPGLEQRKQRHEAIAAAVESWPAKRKVRRLSTMESSHLNGAKTLVLRLILSIWGKNLDQNPCFFGGALLILDETILMGS